MLSLISFSDVLARAGVTVGGSTEYYSSVNNRITIPVTVFTDAIEQQLVITIEVGGDAVDGYIKFLPLQESIPFDQSGYINESGAPREATTCVRTDYVDVSLVRELVVTGRFDEANYSVLYAYDANRSPVRALAIKRASALHVVPDGTYTYVRASSIKSYEHSLLLYYRDRRAPDSGDDER